MVYDLKKKKKKAKEDGSGDFNPIISTHCETIILYEINVCGKESYPKFLF